MSKLHFEYWTDVSYSLPVFSCHYTLKCIPQDTEVQRITNLQVSVEPSDTQSRGADAFGNATVYGNAYVPHQRFSFHVTGEAQTGLAISERAVHEEYLGIYLYPHDLNRPGETLRAYYESLTLPEGTDYDRAVYLMNALSRDYTYEPGATHVGTTAEEAWSLGRGVCQDYAHILIALCHLAGIHARYITGMMMGEGYSHAWTEIYSKGYWYGLDPTNGGVTTENYIKIGVGRHANDCVINRGIVRGGGVQTQEIRVVVQEITE